MHSLSQAQCCEIRLFSRNVNPKYIGDPLNELIATVAIAIFLIFMAIVLLGIGLLITGKSKLEAGACGRDPTHHKKRTDKCGTDISCTLCDKKTSTQKKRDDTLPQR